MVLGALAPPPSAIEVLTGSPFGAQFTDGGLPHFDPLGWDPDLGLDAAIDLLGWVCDRTSGGAAGQAVDRLRDAARTGPVLVGPVDGGLLTHQPWSARAAIGADHWVVVLRADDDTVLFHDPDGFPFATLPVDAFTAAWRAERVEFAEPFVLRSGFRRDRDVDLAAALHRSMPAARRWLGGRPADAIGRLAERLDDGIDAKLRDHLAWFALRVGTRRLGDAATWLDAGPAANIAAEQARLLGSVQYHLVNDDTRAAADILRRLAPRYESLRRALRR